MRTLLTEDMEAVEKVREQLGEMGVIVNGINIDGQDMGLGLEIEAYYPDRERDHEER